MKAIVKSEFPKVMRLKTGDKTAVIKAPRTPVTQTRRFNTEAIRDTFVASPVEFADATFFTALVPKPKLVRLLINPVVVVSSPDIPIPVGPSRTATNFERIIAIIMLKTCTPPKREVALNIC
jgi:hypothetical protein